MISVIIPVRNGEQTIGMCLGALFSSELRGSEYEVVVVDDASTDRTGEVARRYPCRYRREERRAGPAAARNTGAGMARGDILLFLDADMVLEPRALGQVRREFEDPAMEACLGVVDEEPLSPGFVQSYRALSNAHFSEQAAQRDYLIAFGTRCAAIRRAVFESCGAFDTAYRDALVEDEEYGRRVNERHRVRVRRAIRGRHAEPGLARCLWKYIARSYGSARLILANGLTFSRTELSPGKGLGAAAAAGAPLALGAGAPWLALALLSAYLASRLDLFLFIRRRRGLAFLAGALPLDYALAAAAGAGGLLGAASAVPALLFGPRARGRRP